MERTEYGLARYVGFCRPGSNVEMYYKCNEKTLGDFKQARYMMNCL